MGKQWRLRWQHTLLPRRLKTGQRGRRQPSRPALAPLPVPCVAQRGPSVAALNLLAGVEGRAVPLCPARGRQNFVSHLHKPRPWRNKAEF